MWGNTYNILNNNGNRLKTKHMNNLIAIVSLVLLASIVVAAFLVSFRDSENDNVGGGGGGGDVEGPTKPTHPAEK